MEAQFPAFLDRHYPIKGAPPGIKAHQTTKLFLQPLTSIHLNSHLDSEAEQNGDAGRVTTFAAIALFILLIACINYMNLSTARSSLRAREIGIRKVSGALRGEIIAAIPQRIHPHLLYRPYPGCRADLAYSPGA